MRKQIFIAAIMLIGGAISMPATTGPDIKDLLQGLSGGSSSSSSSDLGSTIGSVLNGVLSTSKLTVKDVAGTWKYVEPAVQFQSENLLKKAGGAAASSTITSKIKPYFDKAGMQNLVFTVADDGTFSLGTGKIKASGTIEATDEGGVFNFNFKASSIKLGTIRGYMSKNISGQLTLTFDASKLISLVSTIAKISGNSTAQSVSSLLESYDGLTVGFLMNKS